LEILIDRVIDAVFFYLGQKMKGIIITIATLLISSGCSDASNLEKTKAIEKNTTKLNLDTAKVTVSGISSGGYMANQYHITFSEQVNGAALLSSGPYGCAQGNLKMGLSWCMNNSVTLNIEPLFEQVVSAAKNKKIDPLENLSGDRVWIFHGESDQTVSRNVVEAQLALYNKFAVDSQTKFELNAGHGFPTLAKGVECAKTQSPFINSCDSDIAGEFLSYLYPKANVMDASNVKIAGEVIEFDQSLFVSKGKDNTLADKGYLFAPTSCLSGSRCQLHIAFHGCQQNVDSIGKTFIQDTGITQWASANQIIVLYPQTKSSYLPLNPKACWDWWGYTGADYLSRSGSQLEQVNNMVKQIKSIFN
jgi:poly(3-hydroxybutyrate) depolymerase